jgi:chlorite dismutase
MNVKVISLVLIFLAVFTQAKAQNTYPEYDTASPELNDIQRVINETLPDIEMMLKQKGTFKPFASVILANDSIADIAITDTAKKTYTVDDLKEELSIGALKGLYKVVVIFSIEMVSAPDNDKPKKSVAVFAEHTNDDFAYLFYYPYSITAKKEVIFDDSFGDFAPQVMFRP